VGDYCRLLGEALGRLGHSLQVLDLDWARVGWPRSLWRLWNHARAWRGARVLMQYTAYSWSRSGIPLPFLFSTLLIWARGAKLAVVYHDALPHTAASAIGRLRAVGQRTVMRWSYRLCDVAILTVPAAGATWLPNASHAVTIPVGSNVVGSDYVPASRGRPPVPVVAVFGVTGGPSTGVELDHIAAAIGSLGSPSPLLVFFGAGTEDIEGEVRRRLPAFEVQVWGVVAASKAQELLETARALLFVRGAVTSGRTTAVAAVMAGTPTVGFSSALTGPPIEHAGVQLVPEGDRARLAEALHGVVYDAEVWRAHHERSLVAAREHFAWPAIARAYVDALTR
jgi:glycosyltransferase involved in cell wall biosynthesis